MTNIELKFLRRLYKRDHRLCALYILARNLVWWPFEICLIFPLDIFFGFVLCFCKCIRELCEDIVYTVQGESRQFWLDWRAVYRIWAEKPETT